MASNKMPGNRSKLKRCLWGIGYGVALSAFVVFTLLDTFVIPKNVVKLSASGSTTDDSSTGNSSGSSSDSSGSASDSSSSDTASDSEPVVTDTSYVSDNISINITTIRKSNTNVYIADVVVSDISYLNAGLANNSFGRNITDTTSNIAEDCGAILAINGDYYGFRDSGPVIRNGVLYRSKARSSSSEALAIYSDGNMEVLNESDIDTSALLEDGVLQLFSFGPALVNNGKISVSAGEEVDQSMSSNPRTAIGMISPLHYVLVVSDGRTSESTGLSLSELASVMQDLGCTVAYNLDGGGSSTMWFMGNVVNKPTTNGKKISERKVSDIVYIGQN